MEMPDNLSAAEQRLIDTVSKGEFADFRSGNATKDVPADGANWGPERTLRASVIRALCLSAGENPAIDPIGIIILGARIEGAFDLSWITMPFPLAFNSCYFAEMTTLIEADIRALALSGSYLSKGLNAQGIRVKGDVFLHNGFTASGEVRLLGADIGGQLECNGGRFENPRGHALMADRITVKGNVFLHGVAASGEVRLPGATIGGQLTCTGGCFNNPQKAALIIQNARVAAIAFLRDVSIRGEMDLRNATVGQLIDDENSWPEPCMLYLDGFEYGSIAGASPIDAKSRLKWLSLQPTNNKDFGFRPQPYEQLVKVLRAMGHERDARKIAIAKQKEMRNTLSPLARIWSWILRISTGYGYETWRAFIGMALMVLIGTGVFWFAGNGDMQSTTYGAHIPAFNAFIYSLDTFLPIVDLHQESYWLPQSEFYKWYLWFHISIGWILTTIAVAAFTGLFKDE